MSKAQQEVKDQIERNNHRIMSLSIGIKAIGALLYSVDDNIGFSDNLRCETGYLLSEISDVIVETMNSNTRIEIDAHLKNEANKQ